MSGSDWNAERWCEWLRRNRTQPAPDWRALNDAADAIGKELARLREIEASHKIMLEGIYRKNRVVVFDGAEPIQK